MTRNIILIIVAFQLSGCATGRWFKAGATQQEFQEVNYLCLKESQQPETKAYSSLGGVGYGNNHHRNHTAADFSSNYSSGMVTNEKLFNACMNAYGFYWVIMDNNY
jgi:hypothetical protein